MSIAMSGPTRRRRPGSLAPREARDRFLDAERSSLAESTIRAHYYRLKLFVEWCEEEPIATVDELDGWVLDTYCTERSGAGIKPVSLHNEMKTLRRFIEYLERIEAVDDGLADKVAVPDIPDSQKSNEEQLAPIDALDLLRHYRGSTDRATEGHALLEVLWNTGCRVGGAHALDVRDFEPAPDDDTVGPYLEFHHRPETGTPLKKQLDGERVVGLPGKAAAVLVEYLQSDARPRVSDEHGREPLFTTSRGRASRGTLRTWAYMATQPCVHSPCPHGKHPGDCEWHLDYHLGSKCPSSRSPHRIRTGSIGWQRDLGFPPHVVAERVNATIETIEEYYDKVSELEKLSARRRPYIDRMEGLQQEDDHDS